MAPGGAGAEDARPSRARLAACGLDRGGGAVTARAEPSRARGVASDRPASGLAARAALFVALVAVLLWPVAWNGDPLAFPDSEAYYEQGGQVLDRVEGLIARVVPALGDGVEGGPRGGAAAAEAEDDGQTVYVIRSVPFATMVNASVRIAGVVGPVLLLSAVTAWLILLAVRDLAPGRAAPAALATAGLTTLPFYTSQIMADVMAGWLILIVCLLALRPRVGFWTAAALLVLVFLSIASHYSHVPLGLVLMPALGLALALQRRWGLALAAQAPLVAALALNVTVGQAAGTGLSIAPARLPILLARTLHDGPGREYLAEACPEAGWTLCEVYDEFPTSVREALWGPDSIIARSTDAQRRAIAREEIPLVLAVLRDRPVDQGLALARNAALQLALIGMDDVRHTEIEVEGHRDIDIALDRISKDAPIRALEWAQWGAVAAGLAGLAVALARGGPGVWPAALLLALGLLTNAAVCGGLSAPADRYQGRIIWVLVLLGLALALRRPSLRDPEGWVLDRRGRRVRPRARGRGAAGLSGGRPGRTGA